MIKYFQFLSLLGALHYAHATTVVNEKFNASFSLYGPKLEDILHCEPGMRGSFPTGDSLWLKNHTVDLGVNVNQFQDFFATSDLGLKQDPNHRGPRPYAEGCQLAIDQIKKSIEGKDAVELPTERTVQQYSYTKYRTTRNLKGEVIGNTALQVEKLYEVIKFNLGGFQFFVDEAVNLKSQVIE